MNVLVIAAHPDDEVLGAGCAIAKHAREGDQVSVMFLTDGASARTGATALDTATRRECAENAAKILGVSALHFHNFPDNALDSMSLLEVTRAMERIATAHAPDIVYIHHAGDLNIDHKIAARAALTCFRPLPGSSVKRILAFEIPSATGWDPGDLPFIPNFFLDARALIDLKIAALEAYSQELRPFPHARSIEAVRARAGVWGSQMGMEAAEPFVLLREIVG